VVDAAQALASNPHSSAAREGDSGRLRGQWRAQRDALIRAFAPRMSPAALLRRITAQTDRAVVSLWRTHRLGGLCSLLAVGGYGRAELFPGSDVDLLVCVHQATMPDVGVRIASFIGQCWDLGLEVGHAVRTVEECLSEAAVDITIDTALLEARLLAGDREVFARLCAALRAQRRPRDFMEAKLLEMQQRHARYDDSPYSLEPHVKESPGGLRDLQLLLWIARVAGLPASWPALAHAGILSHSEAVTLAQAQRMLSLIRISLHRLSGRREDRLVFDLQGRVARDLGVSAPVGLHVSEALMQRYYMAAKRVSQMRTVLLQVMESRVFFSAQESQIEDLDDEFVCRDRWIALRDPSLIERDLSVVMRAFVMRQRHPHLRGIAPELLRAIWIARARMDRGFRSDPRQRARFMQLFIEGSASIEAIRDMNQWSVLGRYLPEWRRIVGRMQHDLFHVYTVDQHIITVMRNLRRFRAPEHVHEFPLCSELAAGLERFWRLDIAAMYHDIAKGRGGDHSELGARDVRRFCRAHGISTSDTAFIAWLVRHHLAMSGTAQKQDISDPEVVNRFARLVRTEERLIALYLLTVADVRGTSPKVWNAWKAKLLENLFRTTRRVLAGERISTLGQLDQKKSEALRLLRLMPLQDADFAPFWERLDAAYFLKHEAADIAWHTRVLHQNFDDPAPLVRARLAPHGSGIQVMVFAEDQENLFARITRYFDSRALSVQQALIHTLKGRRALDSFIVTHTDDESVHRAFLTLVEHELLDQIQHARPLELPRTGKASRRSRSFPIPPRIDLRPDSSGSHQILTVSAIDRPGLLYALAHCLSGRQVQVESARITTLGERVEDTFVVRGAVFADDRATLALETDLLGLLQDPATAQA